MALFIILFDLIINISSFSLIDHFLIQVRAHLVDLGKVLVAMVVRTMLEGRDMRVIVHEGIETASTVILLGYWFWDRLSVFLWFYSNLLSDLGCRYGLLLIIKANHVFSVLIHSFLDFCDLLQGGEYRCAYRGPWVEIWYINNVTFLVSSISVLLCDCLFSAYCVIEDEILAFLPSSLKWS